MPPRKPATPKTPPRRKRGEAKTPKPRLRRATRKAPQRILVTGAGGVVGKALVARLRCDGWRLVTLSRRPPSSPSLPGEIHLTGDVCSDDWERWCEDCGVAIHLVGASRPAPSSTDLEALHVRATKRIIEACRTLKIERLLTVSSTDAAPDAGTQFLRSKFTAEQLVEGSGLAWTVVRPTVVFGEGDSFSSGLAGLVRRLPAFPVPGDGTALFQPVAAEDVADTLAALVRCDAAVARSVELGGGERLTLNEVLRRIVHASGRHCPLIHVPLRFAAAASRLARRRGGSWLTDDALTLLLAGSVATSLPADLDLPEPSRPFAGFEWLSESATERS